MFVRMAPSHNNAKSKWLWRGLNQTTVTEKVQGTHLWQQSETSPMHAPLPRIARVVLLLLVFLLFTLWRETACAKPLFITNSMDSNPSWKATNYAVFPTIPSILCNPKVHCRVHNSPPSPLYWVTSMRSTPSSSVFLKFQFNIVLTSTPGSSNWSLSLRVPHHNPVRTSTHTHTHTQYSTHNFLVECFEPFRACVEQQAPSVTFQFRPCTHQLLGTPSFITPSCVDPLCMVNPGASCFENV
jgi:hypothetical protein